MADKTSTYIYDGGAEETVTLSRGPLVPAGQALLKIAYSDGGTSDCYVNTGWLRDRLDDLDPRPLAPDAITDEMVERARQAYNALYPSGAWSGGIRAALEAALIAPTRPEGAERFDPVVDAAIRGYSDITSPDVVRAISDAIAEEMNR